ncbi:hypothetical protein AMAG_19800 [Allomyces macrogynus ATCC 38327]|uniref:Uncharacterized protein n=1 Tax=Allomyces macrogynus (strain ATCC 38327) TaxID=578462 RepID=A0A0L0T0T7_ALLM3|nr:hypothetical protein GGF32_009914 [Allomyces javanicus]KAJ3364768.1 hypothetical protein GGF31_008914 [Allomyces arbusculus]KNE68367.1 hypothetical protein AMAG_19800 [Allomyces macrogynus ATCC 38327]|eukprot:KNE68367.1 hypothetical protein AMAG_19800 [Allomyces macrogynus ATCC 38327]
MGGAPHKPYPRWVYSPTGGWWSQPANWKVNTAVTIGALALLTSFVWRTSEEKEAEFRAQQERGVARRAARRAAAAASAEAPASE